MRMVESARRATTRSWTQIKTGRCGFQSGRCWRERGERRVTIHEHRNSYGYVPRRDRYIERRGYEEGGGIGIHAPGVSVGIGTGRY